MSAEDDLEKMAATVTILVAVAALLFFGGLGWLVWWLL